MPIKEHRIYQYMSEPIRFAGFTLDEICLFVLAIFLFLAVDALFYKLVFLTLGTLGVYFIKKFKKIAAGFSLRSFLHWSLGLRFNLPASWPESWKRYWLP